MHQFLSLIHILPIDYLLYLPQDDYSFSLSPHEFFKMAIPEKFETALEFTKIFGMTDKQIKETLLSDLSGGERKKVYLSFAFALDPVYLLLDEPTNSLDVYKRQPLNSFKFFSCADRKSGCLRTWKTVIQSMRDSIAWLPCCPTFVF